MSPLSQPVCDAVSAVTASYAQHGVAAVERWVENRERLRSRLARLLGAEAHEVALTSNTTQGIVIVAQSLRWKRRDRVVVFSGEFPTNVIPWQQAANLHDLELIQLPLPVTNEGLPDLRRLEAELARGVRLVAISAVQFQTGWRMPLAEISLVCKRAGAMLFVDGIQAAGVVPLDMRDVAIDFVAAGGHKWLMGMEGAGCLYVRDDALSALAPRTAGWMSQQGAFDMLFLGPGHLRYDRPMRREIAYVESGVTHSAGFAALEASTALIESLGLAEIWAHVDAWVSALHRGLLERGIASCRDAHVGTHSGILSIPESALQREGEHLKVAAVAKAFAKQSIAVSTPDGHLRFAPHWPNAQSEVEIVLSAFDAILSGAACQ